MAALPGGISTPTSHVDLIPTLMGLAGIDVEAAAAGVAEHHDEAQPLPGRDLSGLIAGSVAVESVASPLYFMTEDDMSRGLVAARTCSPASPTIRSTCPHRSSR